MQRAWIIVVIAVGAVLGLAIAGIPNRHRDPPLSVTSDTPTTSVSAPAAATPSTTVPPTTPLPPAHPPLRVTVIVVATAGTPKSAENVSRTIHAAGYSTDSPVSDPSDRVSSSVVVYTPGYQADAMNVAVAAGLGGAPVAPLSDSPVPARLASDANVMVVLGSN